MYMIFRVLVKSYKICYDVHRTTTSSHESSPMIPQSEFLCTHILYFDFPPFEVIPQQYQQVLVMHQFFLSVSAFPSVSGIHQRKASVKKALIVPKVIILCLFYRPRQRKIFRQHCIGGKIHKLAQEPPASQHFIHEVILFCSPLFKKYGSHIVVSMM